MNKDPIKCADCGKFISYNDLENEKAKKHFSIEWDWSREEPCEEQFFQCKKCVSANK